MDKAAVLLCTAALVVYGFVKKFVLYHSNRNEYILTKKKYITIDFLSD